jgi:hypothetical protein
VALAIIARMRERRRSSLSLAGREVEGTNTNISNDSNSCVVCLNKTSTHAIDPCGHLCLCETCSGLCNGVLFAVGIRRKSSKSLW